MARYAQYQDMRVAIVSFTALCTQMYRNLHATCCDTVHGFLNWGPHYYAPAAAAKMLSFDVILVDEAMLLPNTVFDALFSAWCMCGKEPVVVLAGDSQQLQPFDEHGQSDRSNMFRQKLQS